MILYFCLLFLKSMGADYYIIKQLRIEHSQGTSTIELDRERAYFPEIEVDFEEIKH